MNPVLTMQDLRRTRRCLHYQVVVAHLACSASYIICRRRLFDLQAAIKRELQRKAENCVMNRISIDTQWIALAQEACREIADGLQQPLWLRPSLTGWMHVDANGHACFG